MAQVPAHSPTLSPLAGTPAPAVGDMMGAYRLDAVAGEGGMGRVFQATHTKLDKRVAVKVLRRRYSRNPEAIARFFQEARAVNVIRHPNIVEITDFFEGPPGGDSYYIMEWLDGGTLADRLSRDRVLSVETVVAIGRQIASALAAVHKAGFVHRDLKPDNIFICQRDDRLMAKILDFGVAMLQGPTDGAVAGTPAYFSPEGAAGRALDGRSDVYSLGVMLYELLSGAPPFQASSLSEYVMKHMTARPRPLSEVTLHPLPPGLIAIVERCLEKDPEKRFQTMDELEVALGAVYVPEVAAASVLRPGRLLALFLLVLLASAAATRGVRALRSSDARTPPVEKAAAASPPAPEVAPAKTAPPVVEEKFVSIEIHSQPSGAEVYHGTALLGVTPCTVRVAEGRQSFDLFRPGAPRTTLEVLASAGGVYTAKLSVPPSPRPASSAGTRKVRPAAPVAPPSRSSTINPFD